MALLNARTVVLLLAPSGCFQSTFLDGLPCEKRSDCDGRHCIDGFCGGPPEPTTSSTTTTTTMTSSMTTTVDPSSDTTADESSSSGEPACELPPHQSCDGSNTLLRALELGCAGELPVVSATMGATQSFTAAEAIGGFTPRAGERFAIVGSGLVAELGVAPPEGDPPNMPSVCSDDVTLTDAMILPSPLTAEPSSGDCVDDPSLIGEMLDCSHSLAGAITQVHDYAELRVGMDVPTEARSFSFAFAFSSTEFPFYQGAMFNDLFVAWLVSDQWTGNIAYAGDLPISVNSGLLLGEAATEALLAGTCMQGHGTTGWLVTSAPVDPGEEIAIVFAVFDQQDSIVDSYVFLDAFEWSCAPVSRPETHA